MYNFAHRQTVITVGGLVYTHGGQTLSHTNKVGAVSDVVDELWSRLDSSERAGIRDGVFPYHQIRALEGQGYNSHAICVALLEKSYHNEHDSVTPSV
jgi:hypothetical protein